MTTCKEKLEQIKDILLEKEEETYIPSFYERMKVPGLTMVMPAIRNAFGDIATIKVCMKEDFDTQSVKIEIILKEKT